MSFEAIAGRLKSFDAYPKTLEDFRTKTYGGAIITMVSAVIMSLLFLSELNYYLTLEVDQELIVDTLRGQKMKIFVDISFPRIGCPLLSIDSMDVSGESQIDVISNIFKERLHIDGTPIDAEHEKHELGKDGKEEKEDKVETTTLDPNRCESCYGAETDKLKCCNTCDDVREAYRNRGWAFVNSENIIQCKREGYSEKMKESQNEGCRIYGFLVVSKVAGNFHIAPGKSFSSSHVHVHDLNVLEGGMTWNTTHNIRHIGFGDDYPGLINPLDSTEQVADKGKFAIILGILFLVEFAMAITVLALSGKVQDSDAELLADKAVKDYRDDINRQNIVDWVQETFECCGVGNKRWRAWEMNPYFNCSSPAFEACAVPYSCCTEDMRVNEFGNTNTRCGHGVLKASNTESDVDQTIYTTGCVDAVINSVQDNIWIVGGVSLGIVIPQLLGIFMARFLWVQVEDQRSQFT